jgi:hypothetical protein
VLSKDDYLQSKGTATGINWHLEYESYLQYLLKGLQQRKASVMNIFRVWDKTLFPHTSNSLSGKSMHITTTVDFSRLVIYAPILTTPHVIHHSVVLIVLNPSIFT